MAKKVVQDVLPPDKRSIRNIPIPEARRPRAAKPKAPAPAPAPAPEPEREAPPVQVERHEAPAIHAYEPASEAPPLRQMTDMKSSVTPPPPRNRPRAFDESPFPNESKYGTSGGKKRSGKKALWFSIIVGLAAIGIAASSLFESATVRITPRQADATVEGVFQASAEAAEGTVPFQIVKVTRDMGKTAPAGAEEDVQTKATGRIMIYNNHGAAEQRLVANTRFETKDGLVYRIQAPITVPGVTTKDGQKIPGSVEAEVVADKPGAEYNITQADFTIPGFKGDPRYETFYARSKTSFSGGYVGKMKVVNEETLAETREALELDLREQLRKDVDTQIPHNFLTFESGLIYSFENLPQTEAAGSPEGTGAATVNVRGVLQAVIFNKNIIAGAVAERALPEYEGGILEISNPESVGFAMGSDKPFKPETDTEFSFTLNGSAHLVWSYDEEALKADLAGVAKSEVDQVLMKYPSIQEAEVVVTPAWKQSLPKDSKKITIDNVVGDGR